MDNIEDLIVHLFEEYIKNSIPNMDLKKDLLGKYLNDRTESFFIMFRRGYWKALEQVGKC